MIVVEAESWWKRHRIMGVGYFRIAKGPFVAVGCWYQKVKSRWEAAVASLQTVTSARWRVVGCSQIESPAVGPAVAHRQRGRPPAAGPVVVCCQKGILPAAVGRAVARQRVRHPEPVELWYSRTKIRFERADAGSRYFQTTHQLAEQAVGYSQMTLQPEAAESEYCRTEIHLS